MKPIIPWRMSMPIGQGQRASISVDGNLLAGALEPRPLGLVREWIELRRSEILSNWDRARRHEALLPIAPLP
jgi:uncharacterized protein DUF4160